MVQFSSPSAVFAITASLHLLFLAATPTLFAFVTTTSHTRPTSPVTESPTRCFAWKKKVQKKRARASGVQSGQTPTFPNALKEFGEPDSESMRQLVEVMGINRVKKAARKQKRVRNQLIREGAIVLNENGEWVSRES